MIGFIKNMFAEKSKKEDNHDAMDAVADIRKMMSANMQDTKTPTLQYPDGFDPDKPTLIILDDNQGATMLFDDDIRALQETRKDLTEGIQFLSITTSQAAFILKAEIDNNNIRNIIGAVLDITLGGYAIMDGLTTTLDGIDSYEIIHERFPKATLRFFTSHTMNKKNAEIYKFMQKFNVLTGEDIEDYTYMKNPFTTSRIDVLVDILSVYRDEVI
jgi:hypothetical protein